MIDLSKLDDDLIVARGKYSTVSGELKTSMSLAQQLAQLACDELRRGLRDLPSAQALEFFKSAAGIAQRLNAMAPEIASLDVQKKGLWQAAWGKQSETS